MSNLMGRIKSSFEATLSGKTLDELMVELARARQLQHDAKAAQKQLDADIAAKFKTQLAETAAKVERANALAEEAERLARERAIVEFNAGQGRKPHANIIIKRYTVLQYDDDEALDYSREHLPSAVKLDKRAFEKVAKVINLDFVRVKEEDRVTVSRDLSALLEEGG